jgi:hypothetical protein
MDGGEKCRLRLDKKAFLRGEGGRNSVSLQRRVNLSREFTFSGREAGISAGVRALASDAFGRRAERGNIAPNGR